MKGTEELKEAQELDVAALEEKIASSKNELMNLRFRKSSGQLDNTAQVRQIRRRVARLMTIRSQKRREESAASVS